MLFPEALKLVTHNTVYKTMDSFEMSMEISEASICTHLKTLNFA